MKTILRILPVLLLIAGLSGCSAQKPAAGTDRRGAGPDALSGGGPEALYGQALKALDERRFVVEAAEFYLPKGGSPVKWSVRKTDLLRMKKRCSDCVRTPLIT